MTIQRSIFLTDQAHVTPLTSIASQNSSRRSISSFYDNNNKSPPKVHCCTSQDPQIQTENCIEQMVDQGTKRGLRYSVFQSSASRRKDELTTKITENKEPIPSTTKFSRKNRLKRFPGYLKSQISDLTSTSVPTSLGKLADLVRLSKYHNRERIYLRARLQRSLISNALSARFLRSVQSIYQSLIDDFRIGEKKNFARLYNATLDMRDSCRKTRQYALLGPEWEVESLIGEGDELLPSFLQEIPSRYREVLLQFLNRIRTDPEYLASRFSRMSSSEISAIIDCHNGSNNLNSKSPSSTRSRGIYSKESSYSSHSHFAVSRFLSFQRHDPLSALIHTCFANSTSPDSPEDLRRLEIWANVCARLITDQKPCADKFICKVLNIWTEMREWPGRDNMEWYLMKIISDGHFLLEKVEDQVTNISSVDLGKADNYIVMEEYYRRAVQGLFEVISNPSAGGIPEGLLELGNAILQNLDEKWHHSTKRFFVSKWLFSIFLLNVVVHPESQGMMAEFYITKFGRQKILKEVFIRAQGLVVDMLWKPTAKTPLVIKTHIEKIILQFSSNRPASPYPKIIPARSLTSLRKVTDSHPYLVVGPADIITIANSLFPEKNFSTSLIPKDVKKTGIISPNSSLSGLFSHIPMIPSSTSQYVLDNSSTLSVGGSSVTSDIRSSQEPLLNLCKSDMSYSEDDGSEIRIAIYKMQQILGIDAVSGMCHPCSERWAVLFVSPDGCTISAQLPDNLEGDIDCEDITTSSCSEDNEQRSRADLDRHYYQLRDTILKLVNDYEIPQNLETGIIKENSFSKSLSHNNPEISNPIPSSRNQHLSKPLNKTSTDIICDRKLAKMNGRKNPDGDNNKLQENELPCALITMLKAAEAHCEARSDFINAHLYCATLKQLNQILSPSLRLNGFESLLNIFSRSPQDSIRHSITAIEFYDSWLTWLKQSQEWYEDSNNSIMRRLKALRDKMWYVTDVRNSAAYEGARNVAVALKSMNSVRNPAYTYNSNSKNENILKSHTKDYLLKTEAQVIDIMAAIEEYGGPKKLSDEQSNKTLQWLSKYGIENLCKGEEHIHRLCLEIESCKNKLVGENLTDGPVLWSSELFSWDQKKYELGRDKRDLLINKLGSFRCSEDIKSELDGLPHDMDSTNISRPNLRDIRAAVRDNGNHQDADFSLNPEKLPVRTLTVSNLMDSQEISGQETPFMTKTPQFSLGSPFQTRVESKNSSYDDCQENKLFSCNDGRILDQQRLNQEKKGFLLQLKQTLTSFLMSDLGNLVFFDGSETDIWFSGELSNECFRRKECTDRKQRGLSSKPRSLQRKSSKLPGGTNIKEPDSVHSYNLSDKIDSDVPTKSFHSKSSELDNIGDKLVMEDYTTNNSRHFARQRLASKDTDLLDFPYKKALHRMMEEFSLHPNPFVKLDILLQVEQLIVASLKPLSLRRHRIQQDSLPTISLSPEIQFVDAFGQGSILSSAHLAKNLEEAIDNCRERRSQGINRNETFPGNRAADVTSSTINTATTDMIVATLQDVFRNVEIRPKTLFRDLQFISSFVPATVLDKTERGKAFWDAALAALGLKQDVCRILIEMADEIVVYHTKVCVSKSHPSSEVDIPVPSIHYSMRNAFMMWTIAAKEGDPVAARELAILYLKHPEMTEKVVAPLSKPQDIFKVQVTTKNENSSKEKSKIANMCIAYHWMEISALGGDELAKRFLKQRGNSKQSP